MTTTTNRIEWDEPIDAVRRVGLEVRCIGGEARNATREDIKRACEAAGLHVVDRGVFDAIVAKGEENRLRAEKAEAELAEVVSLIGGDTAIEGAISACRSLNEVVDQKRGLRSERDWARAESAEAERDGLESEVETLNLALRDCASRRDHANEQNATLRAKLAEAEALTEATRASWQEAIRIKAKLAALERPGCLVERLVAACYDFEVTEQYPEWRVEVRGRKDAAKTVINVPAADVPATLARLAGLDGGR